MSSLSRNVSFALGLVAIVVALFAVGCNHEQDPIGSTDAAVVASDGAPTGHDAGVPCHDAGPADAGLDAGIDAGPSDAGIDAGPIDAGPSDAGIDAGPVDAGPCGSPSS